MAGGMGSRQRGFSLAEPSGLTAAAKRSVADQAPAGRCHCWVISPGGEKLPGLLLEWRRSGGRWEGLTAYLVETEIGEALVQAWIDAEQLHRAL